MTITELLHQQFSSIQILYNKEKLNLELISCDYPPTVIDLGYDKLSDRFYENLEGVIRNQNRVVDFIVLCSEKEVSNRIFNTLEKSLKILTTRKSPLRVRHLSLQLNYMNQVIHIVKLLDPETLQSIEFCFNHGSSSQLIHIEHVLSLVKWNRGDRLKLVFKLNTLTEKNLKSVKKILLEHRVFQELEIHYQNCVKKNLEEYFGVPCQCEPGKFIKFEITEELSDELLLADAMEKLTLINLLSTQALETPVIMRHISQYLEFFDIQRLRKTTRGIRNCIDYIQPDFHISEYTIAFLLEKKPYTVVKTRKGISKTTRYGRDVNFDIKSSQCKKAISRMLEDLETNLKKTCMKELQIVFSYVDFIEYDPLVSFNKFFLDRFKMILAKSEKPLKIEKLVMKCVTQREVMQVLPFLDSSHLKTIELHDPDSEFRKNYGSRYEYPEGLRKPFEVNELCELEQWKNAVGELIIYSRPINMVVRKMNVCNYSKVNITVEKMSSQDILYLKGNLSMQSCLHFYIQFKKSVIKPNNLYNLIGAPRRSYGVEREWCFPISNTTHYLHMDLRQYFIEVRRIPYGVKYY
ncbi:hypothetical protein GCK72_021736 [Caenorhabditis remanei]|uniref:DUF38 domain-containing protein n=1 Tax=Caenorhabditis remanei TaxID=31234 RepID=A0A6A5GIX6_CAERE|nr:hypothetical protein GCK72_021736 [Caenorhabditis remanei]KAF1755167.1 hypothetical protein GCK72_021736 [Caenorhabditis remanei]